MKCTARAADSRKSAGAGTGIRSVSLFEKTASAKTAETTRTTSPKSVISLIAPSLEHRLAV